MPDLLNSVISDLDDRPIYPRKEKVTNDEKSDYQKVIRHIKYGAKVKDPQAPAPKDELGPIQLILSLSRK